MVERENKEKGSNEKLDVKVFYTSGVSYVTAKQSVRPSWHAEEETYEVRAEYGAWGIAVIDNLPFFYVAYNVGGVHDNWSVYRPIRPGKFIPPINSGDLGLKDMEKILKVLGMKAEKDPKKLSQQYSSVFESEENIFRYTKLFERYDQDIVLRAEFGHKVREALSYKHPEQK